MIGNTLEESGWRQGSLVRISDLPQLLELANVPNEQNLVALIASQSCDIANNNVESDPYIELSIARVIANQNGQFTHNKNPRTLHTHVMRSTGEVDVSVQEALELKAFEKTTISKEHFVSLQPDSSRVLEDRQLESYVSWLAARYSRPALPTAFNSLLSAADPRDKLRRIVKKSNEQLVGIYVQIVPDAEIEEHETYDVNLLGLLPAGFDGDSQNAQNAIDAYARVLTDAGMTVEKAVLKEEDVSIAVIKRFKRFYFDDLSFREDTPLPPETAL